jgi:hypothetical protein
MTCLVGVTYGNTVYVGCDSAGVAGSELAAFTYLTAEDPEFQQRWVLNNLQPCGQKTILRKAPGYLPRLHSRSKQWTSKTQ